MKFCPNCGLQLEDNAAFCPTCGHKFEAPEMPQPTRTTFAEPSPAPQYSPLNTMAITEEWDHTAEFDAKDISDNKIIAMAVYLLGTVGIIIALLAANDSKYAAFHARQSLKFTIVNMLLIIAAAVLAFTIIVPIAAGIMAMVLYVVRIISFVSVCKGEAKEPAIIRSLKFLK